MEKLKKIFKIIGIIAIVIGIIIGLIVGFIFAKEMFEDLSRDRERRNSKTLTEYIKTHDYNYVNSSDEQLDFYAEDIRCSDILDKKILAFYSDYLILEDYSVYETTFNTGKFYSNDEQCKKIDTDVKFKDLKRSRNTLYLISENDEPHYIGYNEIKYDGRIDMYDMVLLKDDIKIVVGTAFNDENPNTFYDVVKTDGNLYRQEYKYNHINSTMELVNEEVILSNDTYGKILDIQYSTMINTSMNSYKDLEEEIISKLVTDNGIYIAKYIETEECLKYEDVACETKLVKSEIYEKFKKDIKFMNVDYVFTNDNYITSTSTLGAELDKDVK